MVATQHPARPLAITVPDGYGGCIPYEAQWFHITALDEAGLPKVCERMPHGVVIDLEAGKYAIFYVPRELLGAG